MVDILFKILQLGQGFNLIIISLSAVEKGTEKMGKIHRKKLENSCKTINIS